MSPSPSSEAPADEPQPTIPQQRPNSPLFQEPSPSPDPGPQSSPSSNPSLSSSPSDLDPSEDPTWSTPAPADRSPADGGSGGTPSAGEPVRITRAAIAKGLSGILDTVTRQVARMAHPVEQEHDLWVPEDKEIKAIVDPASRIAYRRLPEGATGNSDALDVLDLALAVGGYVWRNLSKRRQIRTAYQLGDVAGEPAPAVP